MTYAVNFRSVIILRAVSFRGSACALVRHPSHPFMRRGHQETITEAVYWLLWLRRMMLRGC
jgi:hypothetical protein